MASPIPESASVAEVTSSSATTIVVPAPSGITTGNLLMMFVNARLFSTVTAPAGWSTLIYAGPNDFHIIYYRWATAADEVASTYTVTLGNPSMFGNASIVRISGAKNPLSVSHTWDRDSPLYQCLTITPPAPDSLWIWGCACAQGGQGNTTANKGTEQVDLNGTYGSMSVYTLPVASGSPQAGATITGGSVIKTVFSVAIEPAPASSFVDNTTPVVRHLWGGGF